MQTKHPFTQNKKKYFLKQQQKLAVNHSRHRCPTAHFLKRGLAGPSTLYDQGLARGLPSLTEADSSMWPESSQWEWFLNVMEFKGKALFYGIFFLPGMRTWCGWGVLYAGLLNEVLTVECAYSRQVTSERRGDPGGDSENQWDYHWTTPASVLLRPLSWAEFCERLENPHSWLSRQLLTPKHSCSLCLEKHKSNVIPVTWWFKLLSNTVLTIILSWQQKSTL